MTPQIYKLENCESIHIKPIGLSDQTDESSWNSAIATDSQTGRCWWVAAAGTDVTQREKAWEAIQSQFSLSTPTWCLPESVEFYRDRQTNQPRVAVPLENAIVISSIIAEAGPPPTIIATDWLVQLRQIAQEISRLQMDSHCWSWGDIACGAGGKLIPLRFCLAALAQSSATRTDSDESVVASPECPVKGLIENCLAWGATESTAQPELSLKSKEVTKERGRPESASPNRGSAASLSSSKTAKSQRSPKLSKKQKVAVAAVATVCGGLAISTVFWTATSGDKVALNQQEIAPAPTEEDSNNRSLTVGNLPGGQVADEESTELAALEPGTANETGELTFAFGDDNAKAGELPVADLGTASDSVSLDRSLLSDLGGETQLGGETDSPSVGSTVEPTQTLQTEMDSVTAAEGATPDAAAPLQSDQNTPPQTELAAIEPVQVEETRSLDAVDNQLPALEFDWKEALWIGRWRLAQTGLQAHAAWQVRLEMPEGATSDPDEPVFVTGRNPTTWRISGKKPWPQIVVQVASEPGSRWTLKVAKWLQISEESGLLPATEDRFQWFDLQLVQVRAGIDLELQRVRAAYASTPSSETDSRTMLRNRRDWLSAQAKNLEVVADAWQERHALLNALAQGKIHAGLVDDRSPDQPLIQVGQIRPSAEPDADVGSEPEAKP